MILDTSAIVAILRAEPDWRRFASAIDKADRSFISAGTYIEIGVVLERLKLSAVNRDVDRFLEEFNISVEPVTVDQARIAREAYRDYGRGSGHRACLNFGDCFSYALARATREPILFKGDDFIHTDLRSAIPPS
jgi:ribonuclease VapC